jgi:hypothetical protein
MFAAIPAMLFLLACVSEGQPPAPTPPSGNTPPGWLTYSNAGYGFAVAYPDALGIVPESTPPPGGAFARVRFLEREMLAGQFADLEPPRFMVEVFPLGQATTLTEWARAAGRLPQGAASTAVPLAGAREGLRIQMRQQLAPNEFYYFRTDQRVYVLTPFGQYSVEMLESFRLIS